MTFSSLPHISPGTVVRLAQDGEVRALLLDSRKMSVVEGTLFFAIKGERNNGHHHLTTLYQQGIRNFVVEEIEGEQLNMMADANIFLSSSSVEVLQQIAAAHRKRFNIPVIGITGSNGKTIIKEWLFQLLSKSHAVVKNPGSYNSQVGVPLSVWQMDSHHRLGVFEAGISKPGEMDRLEKIIRPTVGIFTNIGPAHSEGFSSTADKISEKLKLFNHAGTLIYCKDHSSIDEAVSDTTLKTFSWGVHPEANVRISMHGESYEIHWANRHHNLHLPFTDSASVENCFHCIALMLHLGFDPEEIQERISSLKRVPMRLELKEGINQCYIIDDTYNNDLAGIEISLQFLTHQKLKKNKTAILSDVLQSGMEESTLMNQIAELLSKHGVSRLIGVGTNFINNSALFPAGSQFFGSTDDFLANFDTDTLNNEVVLIKGARTFEFERIAAKLQRKVHGTVMEIDLGSIIHNLNYIKSRLRQGTKVMVMVKAFAYGSGSNEIASLLQYHKADYLGVAYADEGAELRKSNISLPIMVMNPSEDSFEQLFRSQLEPEVYSFRILRSIIRFLNGRQFRIHLKLDTGMHRLGFNQDEIEDVITILTKSRNIEIASIFSHLAAADESQHDKFSHEQARLFHTSAEKICTALGYRPLLHLLNSPGILRLPEYQFDMVRLGIGLYGVDPTGARTNAMRPVATLKTVISQVKQIPAGESIGYGRRGRAARDTRIATIAIGYADGYSRAFSRGIGRVLIGGKQAPVIGNVCMDMTMIDVTDIEAREGDDVIIFGKDLPIEEVASSINTIPYEILTNTSERVKRVFIAESL